MHKNKVYISAPMFEPSDLDEFITSKYGKNTEFETFLEHGLIDPGIIHCVFIVIQNMANDAVYDLVKYCILRVYNVVFKKRNDSFESDTTIKVEYSEEDKDGNLYNHKTINISTSYKMNADERERAINNAVESLLGK